MSERKAVQVVIRGEVQGVGFRMFAKRQADALGVVGTIRNRHDGSVEVWAEGADDKLREFVNRLQEGPISATVRDATTTWGRPTDGHDRFRIIH